ncbi:MAG: hypothetical protein K8R88_08245 [Armatimonadetes bacterium]|nr:hypothetical protein [Armatimonadota bacterium]
MSILLTRMQIDLTKIAISAGKISILLTKMLINLTRMQINLTKITISTGKMSILLTKMLINLTKMVVFFAAKNEIEPRIVISGGSEYDSGTEISAATRFIGGTGPQRWCHKPISKTTGPSASV